MMLSALKVVERFDGVAIATRSSIEMSMREIVERKLNDFVRFDGTVIGAVSPGHDDEEARPLVWDLAERVVYRARRGRREVEHAVIFYDSFGALVGFLAERLVPTGGGRLAGLVEEARAGRGRAGVDRARLEEMIDESSTIYQQYRRHRFYRGLARRALPLVLTRTLDEHMLEREKRDDGEYYMLCRCHGSNAAPLFGTHVTVRHRGHPLQRVAFIAPAGDPERDRWESHDMQFLHFDGTRHRWVRDLDDLGPGALRAFEAHGLVFRRTNVDVLPGSGLRARCVVRVPPARAAKKAAARLGSVLAWRARSALLRRPAFVLECHVPVELDGSEPVVTAPGDALFLLSRTTRGIYIPDDAAREPDLRELPDEPTYLVVAAPADARAAVVGAAGGSTGAAVVGEAAP